MPATRSAPASRRSTSQSEHVVPWDEFDWHIKAGAQSAGLTLVQAFFATWGIAFFFLIAGVGTYLALRWRSAGAFARERALRLLGPLAMVWATLEPVQSYLEETFDDRYHGSSSRSSRRSLGCVARAARPRRTGPDPDRQATVAEQPRASAMPFFLIHQPVILAVAFVVIPEEVGTAVELPIVVVVSFALSATLAFGATRMPGLASAFGVKRHVS